MAALLSPDTTFKNLFIAACDGNDLQKVQYLFHLGADVNWRDLYGWSGLHIAAENNYGELQELLLSKTGVNVNIRRNDGQTPLMAASIRGNKNIMMRLCQVDGIQVNSRDVDGWTALHWAVYINRAACVSVLGGLAGIDWNARSNAGNYPLTMAVENGFADILQIILSQSHLELNMINSRGRNIAQLAVESPFFRGDRQRCLKLLCGDRRFDPYWNVKNPDGETPVMFCLKNDRTAMATTLIANSSVDLDTVDSEGRHLEDIARSVFNI